MFDPDGPPIALRKHPFRADQTAIMRGQLTGGVRARPYWGVAIAHLAHARGTCERCESVWRTADEQWAGVPDEGNHEALFGVVEVGDPANPGAVLVHIDDIPTDSSEH